MASTSASRWPSDRSRGCRPPSMPGASRSSRRRAEPGRATATRGPPAPARRRPSRGRAGRSGSAAPARRARGGPRPAGRGGSWPRDVDRCRRAADRCPAPPTAARTCPTPLRPISATISPACRSRSTSRTATRSPYLTTTRAHPSGRSRGRRRRDGARRRGDQREPVPQRAGRPAGVAHATAAAAATRRAGPAPRPAARRRRPPARAAGGAVDDGAVGADLQHPVGVLHDALEAVLGEHHGDAEVVHEPGDRREHLLGRGRVQRRTWARRAPAPAGAR